MFFRMSRQMFSKCYAASNSALVNFNKHPNTDNR